MTRQEEPYNGCFFDKKKGSLLADLKRGFAQTSFLFAALHVRQPDRLSVKFRPSFFCTVQNRIFKSKYYLFIFLTASPSRSYTYLPSGSVPFHDLSEKLCQFPSCTAKYRPNIFISLPCLCFA